MGIFNFLKKKKKEELPMPPPPMPPDVPPLLKGDFEPIRGGEKDMTDLPEPPKFEVPAPQFEIPEMPAKPQFDIPEFPEEKLLPAPSGEKEVRVFDKTIPSVNEEVEEEHEVVRHMPSRPAFVAVDDYKRIINDSNMVRSKLMEAENFVRRLGDLKNEEERTFEKWKIQLESVEKKLTYVDKIIAKR